VRIFEQSVDQAGGCEDPKAPTSSAEVREIYGSMVSTPGGWKWYEANRHVFSTAVQPRLEEVMSSDAVGT
jgi:hypothetical protein